MRSAITQDQKDEAYNEGFDAGKDGKPFPANHNFHITDPRYLSMQEGYKEGRKKVESKDSGTSAQPREKPLSIFRVHNV